MAAGVREDVGYEYTCFMRGGEDARLHERFSGGGPSSLPVVLKCLGVASMLCHKPGQDILSTSAEIPDCIPLQRSLVTSLVETHVRLLTTYCVYEDYF